MHRLSLAILASLASVAFAAPTPAPTTPAPATPAPASATPVPSAPAPVPSGTPRFTFAQCHVDGPYIAMTFDDGPSGPNTPRLLDMLKQRHIHATFFMVGQNAAEYPDIVKRVVAEGHEVGNHSWSHPQLNKMTDEGVRNELQKTHDAIVAGGGVAPKLLRPPYGAFTARQRAWANGTWGYKIILWDVDPLDWKIRNSEHVKSEILKQTVQGSIILSHDIHKTTVDAMPETLDALLAKGFKFVTVSELIAMDHPATPRPKSTPSASPAAKKETTESSAKAPLATPSPAPAANH